MFTYIFLIVVMQMYVCDSGIKPTASSESTRRNPSYN